MSRARRLFFALWPDDAVRQALLHWQTQRLAAKARWQHRADLHLTLHFLGTVEPDRLDPLRALGDAVSIRRFVLVLDQLGHWSRPQVLWCGPTAPPAELLALHRRVGEGLSALGLPLDRRPFRPHVTLARKVRSGPEVGPIEPLDWTVREWALVESRPGERPHYRPVYRWTLS